jgi:hypothetical protein
MGVGSALVAAAGIGLFLGGAEWLHILMAVACFVFLGTAIYQCWLLVLRVDDPAASRLEP